jgi:alanyl-tRNA synthetase
MLGNWSFGDYFKKEAIEMAWKCLTVEFKLDPSRLYATYFAGDENTPVDDEARQIWLQYLPPDRVLPFGAKDNFWEMGATGPCGPCTEIHYDRIGGRDASKLVNADLPDVIEIWNNVFIQFNREADGSLRPLPAQHVDTGMGFERLTSILQGVDSNYDTDIFIPLFDAIQKITGARPYAGKIGAEDPEFIDMAYRVVADHVRTLSFAIADGAVPSNDGRGYVLRRVLRRAVRYGRQNLNAELGFFAQLVRTLVELMGDTFPELREKEEYVTSIIREEEESFSKTVDKGIVEFKKRCDAMGDGKVFSGDDAHFLYTSMGFPVDLTELMCEERGLSLNMAGFEAKMQHEQELSNAAHLAKMSAGSGKDMRLVAEQTSHLVGQGVDATNDDAKYVWNEDLAGCTIKALFIGRNETEDGIGFVDSISKENGAIGVVLDKTSFYGESGGQTFDTGSIKTCSGATIQINNVQIYGSFVLHIGEVTEGSVSVGDAATCCVDYVRRAPIAANHTMTHVLNYALRDVLITKSTEDQHGAAVDQKGSLVDENKLRFDFSWSGPLTSEQLEAVEKLCQNQIKSKIPVDTYVAPLDGAQKISSLRAVFGEVYPDPVRVVAVSPIPITFMLGNPQDSQWNAYSVEFCGGTHLKNTSEAEGFVLLSEEGIAKGVRRITGVTMKDAAIATATAADMEAKITAAGNLDGLELEAQVKLLTVELESLSISAAKKIQLREVLGTYGKNVVAWKKAHAAEQTAKVCEQVIEAASSTEGNKVVVRCDFGVDGKVAKAVTTAYGKKITDKALLLVTADEESDRFMVIAFAPKGMQDIDCKAWVTAATEGTNGKGGGKKDSAQFTVPGVSSIDGVLEKARGY